MIQNKPNFQEPTIKKPVDKIQKNEHTVLKVPKGYNSQTPFTLNDINLNDCIWNGTYLISTSCLEVPVEITEGTLSVQKINNIVYQKIVPFLVETNTYTRQSDNGGKSFTNWVNTGTGMPENVTAFIGTVKKIEDANLRLKVNEKIINESFKDVNSKLNNLDKNKDEFIKMFTIEADFRDQKIQELADMLTNEQVFNVQVQNDLNLLADSIVITNDKLQLDYEAYANELELTIAELTQSNTHLKESVAIEYNARVESDNKLSSDLQVLKTMFKSLASANDLDTGELETSTTYHQVQDNYKMVVDYLYVDSSNASFKVHLPSDPKFNQIFYVLDVSGTLNINNVTLIADKVTIMGLKDYPLNKKNKEYKIIFTGKEYRVI